MSGFLQTLCCSTSMQVREAAHISYFVAAYSWKAHEQKAHEQCRNNTRAVGDFLETGCPAHLSNQLPHWCPRSKPARRLQLQQLSCPHFTKKIGSLVASYFLCLGVPEGCKANTITTNFDLLCPMGSLCPRMAVAGFVGSWVAIWTGLMQWLRFSQLMYISLKARRG